MAPQSPRKAEVVIARSKRTTFKYPARTSHLSGSLTTASSQDIYLHYTDKTRLQACRCLEPWDHERAYPVRETDKNLAVSVTRYMTKFGLDMCSVPTFYRYYEQQKIEWALTGVCAERFHYTKNHKSVVCRCLEREHLDFRRVQNPEIQELCAKFFKLHATETTCTREQWRTVESRIPEPCKKSSTTSAILVEPAGKPLTPRIDPFEYDSASVIRLLEAREKRPRSSHAGQSKGYSCRSVDMAHLSSGSNGEADIPENVWRVSRPSVYLGQHDIESCVSTPLGSSVTPGQHIAHEDTERNIRRSPLVEQVSQNPWVSLPVIAQRNYGRTPSSSWPRSPIKDPRSLYLAHSPQLIAGPSISKIEVADPEVDLSETMQPIISSSYTDAVAHAFELPTPEAAVELEAIADHHPILQLHSPTFRELDGSHLGDVAELAVRRHSVQTVPLRTRISSRRLTRTIDHLLWDTKLPNQKEFFLRYVTITSRAYPTPLGNCSVCRNSYQAPSKHTIKLTCGHFVHKECLMSNFRSLDHEFGNCPVCGMALCERTLRDQIDTDREAIFGQAFSSLSVEERIEFAQRGEEVTCGSAEEVAATQIRLLKDYVDVHADELYRQWQRTALEPDWHRFVVLPVVQLFKGWSLPTHKCRYFSDRDAFYMLIVWAELVRLMNTTRDYLKKTQGQGARFPQLNELYRNFLLAKERYETEKLTWLTKWPGVFDCEKVAQDAISMAVSAHLDSHY